MIGWLGTRICGLSTSLICQQFNDSVFDNCQVRLIRDDKLHALCIFALGTLCAGGLDSGTTAQVQCFNLQGCGVGITSHFSTERIKFIDEVAFSETADRRIARHPSDRVFAGSNQKRVTSHTGSCQSGLGAGVSTADDDHVMLIEISLHVYIIQNYLLDCEQIAFLYYATLKSYKMKLFRKNL